MATTTCTSKLQAWKPTYLPAYNKVPDSTSSTGIYATGWLIQNDSLRPTHKRQGNT